MFHKCLNFPFFFFKAPGNGVIQEKYQFEFWAAFLQTKLKETTFALTSQLITIMQSFFCTQPTGGGQALCVWHGVSSYIKTVLGTFRAYVPSREVGLLASKNRLLRSRHFGDRVPGVPVVHALTLVGVLISP